MKNKIFTLALVGALALAVPATTNAAAPNTIEVSSEIARLDLGGAINITVDYSGVVGGYSDLGYIVSDDTIASVIMADTDPVNKKATICITGTGIGSAVVAIYQVSNPAIVDYINVESGYTSGDTVQTYVNGQTLTTIYNDLTVQYNYLLTGKNDAQFQVTGLVTQRPTGLYILNVTGYLTQNDSLYPGLNTFYANFYGKDGLLIRRQGVYNRDPETATTLMELEWVIPEGCVSVVLE